MTSGFPPAQGMVLRWSCHSQRTGIAVNLVQLQRDERNSQGVRNGRRKGSAFGVRAFGWACWNQDTPDAHKLVIPDETQVVKIFHVCQLSKLIWSDKDAYMVTVFQWQSSRKPKVHFPNCPTGQVYVGFFLPLKMAKASSRALRNSHNLITVRQNKCFNLNVVLCTQESTN